MLLCEYDDKPIVKAMLYIEDEREPEFWHPLDDNGELYAKATRPPEPWRGTTAYLAERILHVLLMRHME